MANSNPPKRAQAFTGAIALQDLATPGSFKSNPTLAAGDVKISKDGGALANMASLPAVTPASSIWVEFVMTGTEMTADRVYVQFIDQTSPKEWADAAFVILTTP